LLGLWGLPTAVTEALAHHHAPGRVPHQGFDAVVAVCVANTLAHPVSASALRPESMNVELLESLDVADRYPAWQEAAQPLVSRATEVSHAGG
jgi:hypothetical protein